MDGLVPFALGVAAGAVAAAVSLYHLSGWRPIKPLARDLSEARRKAAFEARRSAAGFALAERLLFACFAAGLDPFREERYVGMVRDGNVVFVPPHGQAVGSESEWRTETVQATKVSRFRVDRPSCALLLMCADGEALDAGDPEVRLALEPTFLNGERGRFFWERGPNRTASVQEETAA